MPAGTGTRSGADRLPWPWRAGLCWGLSCLLSAGTLQAQCAMCKAAVAGSANGEALARGLNQGILFLLAVPVLLVSGTALLIWRSRRQLESRTGLRPAKRTEPGYGNRPIES